MIVVRVPYDESTDEVVDVGTDVYWAVKPSAEEIQAYRRSEGGRPSTELPTAWRIMGSWDGTVTNRETLQGFRGLRVVTVEELWTHCRWKRSSSGSTNPTTC